MSSQTQNKILNEKSDRIIQSSKIEFQAGVLFAIIELQRAIGSGKTLQEIEKDADDMFQIIHDSQIQYLNSL